MSDRSDRDLEQLFAEVRAADARSAPSFGRTIASRPAARPWRVLLPALATGALVALVAVWRLTSTPDVAFVIRPGDLRVPTDYLMDLVSVARAGEIPTIGVVDWFPLEPPDNRRPQ